MRLSFVAILFADYISQKQSLGGLLILLPQTFRPGNVGGGGSVISETEGFRKLLAQLEKLLVHGNIPVSVFVSFVLVKVI